MKLGRAISTVVLSLALGASVAAYAQQDQHEQEENKDKPAREKETKAQAEKTAKPEEKNAQRENNNKPEEKNAEQRAQPAQRANGNRGGRIPDARFKANFGRQHTFRVSQGDYRNHRFQYGGYWFGFVDPWPSNWLYTQNVYVIDMNGAYYLCNPAYPGVNVAINVTL
jgi:hypothetical protein